MKERARVEDGGGKNKVSQSCHDGSEQVFSFPMYTHIYSYSLFSKPMSPSWIGVKLNRKL